MIKFDRPLIKKRFFLLIVCFCFVSEFVSAQTIRLNTPSDSLTVGEVFDLSISVKSSSQYNKIIFPDSNSFGKEIEFRSSKHFKVSNSADSAEYKLQFFGIEDITIPPLPVKIVIDGDTSLVFTEPALITYKPVISSEEDPLNPLKPNFKFPRAVWPYLIIMIILLAIGILIWWKYFKNKPAVIKEEFVIPDFENPIDELELKLKSIKEKHTEASTKDYKWFYSELGDALRWYVEMIYKIPALESTTREVIRYMDAFGVDIEMVKHARIILNEADMIKFAKFKPTLDESWKAFNEGWAFYERARIVDISRIQRMKTEFEKQFEEKEDYHGMG